MGYKRAEEVLPLELLEQIQEYVAGESIYIPRRKNERRHWGEQTETRKELTERNLKIKKDYSSGYTIKQLAEKYFLSQKSIQRILYSSED
ncbi:MAG: hypothetical protein K1W39_15445 [Lachnospiraceae bacterium]|jgi:Response regulator containing a CheY-like receiver domain and an HTH DNA-binding domain|nr:hypothetical protein [Lachnospiraceae bacterium]